MKLLIKQRVFSWTDTYDIYDESGSAKYFVKAEIFTWGHQIHVYAADNREVGGVYQRLFRFLPEFEVEIFGRSVGTIKKEFSFFKPRYNIDYNGWYVEGNFLGWDYEVYDKSRVILHISKELFRWGDTYVLDFENPEDELMGLLLVIAIDAANCSNSN
ncbi:MAG: hypothetical protein NC223_10660 [Butyrivibrio sp.]|nr:hypothetical protein [Butyrivibrio sp.]